MQTGYQLIIHAATYSDCCASPRMAPPCTSAAVLVQQTHLLLVGNDTMPISMWHGDTRSTDCRIVFDYLRVLQR